MISVKKYRIYNLTDNLLFPMIRFVNIGLPLLHTGVSAEIFINQRSPAVRGPLLPGGCLILPALLMVADLQV